MPLINKWVHQRQGETPEPALWLRAAEPALHSLQCRLALLHSLRPHRTLRVRLAADPRQAGREQRALAGRSGG